MKNLLKLFSVSLMVCALVFTGCKKDDLDPTNLNATNITATSAKLLWTGSADSFEYEVTGGATPITGAVTTNEVTVQLVANTTYNWKIRAKKGNEYSNWVNGASFKTTMPTGPEITVTFGSEKWTATVIDGSTGNDLFEIIASKTSSPQFPTVIFGGNVSGTTNIEYGYSFPLCDYYENEILPTVVQGQPVPSGDWWAQSGTLTVTSFSNNKISGTANVTMTYEREKLDGVTIPQTRSLQIVFKNVDLKTAAKSFKTSSSRVVK